MMTDFDNDPAFLKVNSFRAGTHSYDVYVADESYHAMRAMRHELDKSIGRWRNLHLDDPEFNCLDRENEFDDWMNESYALWMKRSGRMLHVFRDGMLHMVGVVFNDYDSFGEFANQYCVRWHDVLFDQAMPTDYGEWHDQALAGSLRRVEGALPGNLNKARTLMAGNSVFERTNDMLDNTLAGICVCDLTYSDLTELSDGIVEAILGRKPGKFEWIHKSKVNKLLGALCDSPRVSMRRYLARNVMLNDCCWERLRDDPDWRVRSDMLAWMNCKYLSLSGMDRLLADPVYEVRLASSTALFGNPSDYRERYQDFDARVHAFMDNGYDDDFKACAMGRIMEHA